MVVDGQLKVSCAAPDQRTITRIDNWQRKPHAMTHTAQQCKPIPATGGGRLRFHQRSTVSERNNMSRPRDFRAYSDCTWTRRLQADRFLFGSAAPRLIVGVRHITTSAMERTDSCVVVRQGRLLICIYLHLRDHVTCSHVLFYVFTVTIPEMLPTYFTSRQPSRGNVGLDSHPESGSRW